VPAEEDAVREVSEEQGARIEEPRAGETPLFLPTPDVMATEGEGWAVSFVSFLCDFLCIFLGALHIFLGYVGLGAGQRGACNVPPPRG